MANTAVTAKLKPSIAKRGNRGCVTTHLSHKLEQSLCEILRHSL